jgi:hypothetical protein
MISFTGADVDRSLAEDNGEPVVMLELLRFRPDGGREQYFEYLSTAQPTVRALRRGDHLRRRWRDAAGGRGANICPTISPLSITEIAATANVPM